MLFNNIEGINSLRQIAGRLQITFKKIQELCTMYMTTLKQNQNQYEKNQAFTKQSNKINSSQKSFPIKNGGYSIDNTQNCYSQNETKVTQSDKRILQNSYNDSEKNKYILLHSQNNFNKTLSKKIQPVMTKKVQKNSFKETNIQKKQTILQSPQPLEPFNLFLKEKKATITKQYPQLSPQEMAQVMKQIWNGLTRKQKQPYQRMYELTNSVYNKNIKQFQEFYKKDNKGRS